MRGTCPSFATSGAVASETADNYIKDSDDAVDWVLLVSDMKQSVYERTDGHADGANSVDNCHDASADGLEDTLNLCEGQYSVAAYVFHGDNVRRKRRHPWCSVSCCCEGGLVLVLIIGCELRVAICR